MGWTFKRFQNVIQIFCFDANPYYLDMINNVDLAEEQFLWSVFFFFLSEFSPPTGTVPEQLFSQFQDPDWFLQLRKENQKVQDSSNNLELPDKFGHSFPTRGGRTPPHSGYIVQLADKIYM